MDGESGLPQEMPPHPQNPPGSQSPPRPQSSSLPQDPPSLWGRPPGPADRPGTEPGGAFAVVPEAQRAYSEGHARSAAKQNVARESSGVEVRLTPRPGTREREVRARRRGRGRRAPVALGVSVLAGLVTAGIVLTSGSRGGGGAVADGPNPGTGNVRLPPHGTPVEVATADGVRYRLAAVSAGFARRARGTASRSSGMAYPYIDYLLTNPTRRKVLLEYPGDVFVRRSLVAPAARGRCEPQGGVPAALCTPPTRSAVVRRVAGGALVPGDGGDRYLPPGSTYLVRVTVRVPVDRRATRADMGLYVWEQIFVGTDHAERVPFPG